ncbi:capsid assembly scaffolding protein Gp46 family protein [Apilactobacillus xinyiensis]|uniref:capsid assembly scaffolding protein Gp46 family protein n=1 Tax=Apilactobacillus xinyiensis TaxID=2841032 RepID=UPI00200EFDC9|nr:DUF4355 domain-containing protein [Apilactobacillus xinyiensis]MCL0330829.1 DUF4355 domain-containing protein [Apilactobacillus xinyiensis]
MAEPTDPTNTGQGGGEGKPTHKNVSLDDFKAFKDSITNTLGGLGSKLDQVLGGNPNNDDPKPPKDFEDDKKGDKDNPNQGNDEKYKGLDEATKKRLEYLEKREEERVKKERTANLTAIAQQEAEAKGIKIDGFVSQLIGEDEQATKSNVEAFAKTIAANSPATTNNGFDTSKDIVKDGKSFMNEFLDNTFGKQK